jgi:excisionase family DNA binding protein
MAEAYQPPDGYLTIEGAAVLLGVSLVTVRKIIRDAGLQTFRDHRKGRV